MSDHYIEADIEFAYWVNTLVSRVNNQAQSIVQLFEANALLRARNTVMVADALEPVQRCFRSGNSVPVERNTVYASDWHKVMERVAEMEVALAQAVEFAQYTSANAKGKMAGAAEHFLSLPYAKELATRIKPKA